MNGTRFDEIARVLQIGPADTSSSMQPLGNSDLVCSARWLVPQAKAGRFSGGGCERRK
jgi:hypothetical protein